jgi:ABC-type branched-subunit amino acid transport system substrate-binding protein
MAFSKWGATVSAAIFAWLAPIAAQAADKVVIGDIDDMSGLYADINGPRAVEGVKMAIADFGGSALGQPIELLTADHQNKPDLGASKFREWADTKGSRCCSAVRTPVSALRWRRSPRKGGYPFSRSAPQALR